MYYKDYSIDKYAKGGIFKDKLLGSSPNYDGILKLLKQYFISPNIFLTEGEIGGNYYVINNSKGVVKDYYVFFSKGRYRFFEKDKSNSDANILEKDYKLKQRISNNKKEIANLKKSTTESLENENTLKYALQNVVSSGTIASITDITEYEEINDIRLEAIKILDKEGNKFYSKNGLKDILQKAKESLKLKTNDKSINYAKNIKEGNKYGDWTLTYYKPISETIGAIRLVNQETIDKIELIGDSLNKTWFTSYNGIQIEEKNPEIVIEKVLELANKNIDESKTEDIEQVEIKKGEMDEGVSVFDMENEEPNYNSISELQDELNRLVRWSNQYGNKGADAKIKQLRERIEYLKKYEKENNIDNLIKSLEISLKYSDSKDKINLEKLISALKITQKYEVKNEEINRLKDNPEAKIIYDNLPQILNIKSSNLKSEYDSVRVDLALEIDEIMMKEAPANWLGDEPRGKVILNLLYNVLDQDKDATLKLFELLKTIPKYQHSSTDIITETYNRVSNGKIDSGEGAIFLNKNGIEVTYEIYDELRDLEKKFRKKLRGLEVGDIITVKGKNGNKDFSANFRGKTNDGKLIVTFEGGKQMSINSDEYY